MDHQHRKKRVIQIEKNQKEAFEESLILMAHIIRTNQVPLFADKKRCLEIEGMKFNYKYVDKLYSTEDCKMKTTFKSNPDTPDLQGQVISIEMSFDEEQGKQVWVCRFSGRSASFSKDCDGNPIDYNKYKKIPTE